MMQFIKAVKCPLSSACESFKPECYFNRNTSNNLVTEVGPHHCHAAFKVWSRINFWMQPTENGLQNFWQELSTETNINISR